MRISTANTAFFEALGSASRLRIIELLSERSFNVKDIASALGISSAITTRHIQQLEAAGIIRCESAPARRGLQKVCSLSARQIVLTLGPEAPAANTYSCSIPVGQYVACDVKPTCGMASPHKIIGVTDDSRYFADPEHVHAAIVWFGSGWVEYRIPNYLLARQRPTRMQLTFEICSEAPGYAEDWPSDITFSINNVELGTWTSPGDFGAKRGVHTPQWWSDASTQHGLLKTLTVGPDASFVDGVRMSSVGVGELGIGYGREIRFRIACLDSARHRGGVSLFGRNFGNYDLDIEVQVEFAQE